jgi:hypothetical protein
MYLENQGINNLLAGYSKQLVIMEKKHWRIFIVVLETVNSLRIGMKFYKKLFTQQESNILDIHFLEM